MKRLFNSLRLGSATGRKFVLAAAVGCAGLAIPSIASARDNDRYDHVDHRDFHNDYRDHDRDHSDLRVNVRIGEPAYERREDRVWVEPVTRTTVDRVWVEPEYRTVSDRVWRPAETKDVCERVFVEAVYQDRVCSDRHGRHVERVLVSPGHWEERHRTVVVCEAHWENVDRQVLVCDGHWQNVERQEVI